jgi:predicted transcriptional regulator of viral defense system/very-short-patch-repair endonuclease
VRERAKRRNSHTTLHNGGVDHAIARIASRQHGVVSLDQLFDLGLSVDQVKYRLKVGRLFRIHRGVYAVGRPDLDRYGRWLAATLTCTGAVLSHRPAAEAIRLLKRTRGATHVTAPRQVRIAAPIVFHRRTLPSDELTTWEGIPITALARTLLDVAATNGELILTRALREAHFQRLSDRLSLHDLLERYPRHPGTRAVRSVLERGAYLRMVRSDFEGDFLEFVSARGLPLPETNAVVELAGERIEVDCLWRVQRVIVELDDYSTHGTPEAMEEDRRRDGLLQAAGWAVHRITGQRLDPPSRDQLERQLRPALDCR